MTGVDAAALAMTFGIECRDGPRANDLGRYRITIFKLKTCAHKVNIPYLRWSVQSCKHSLVVAAQAFAHECNLEPILDLASGPRMI
jgi:hypothetical protein